MALDAHALCLLHFACERPANLSQCERGIQNVLVDEDALTLKLSSQPVSRFNLREPRLQQYSTRVWVIEVHKVTAP